MTRPLFVFEDVENTSRHRLFRFLGVEVMATTYAWLGVLSYSVLGVLVSFGQYSEKSNVTIIVAGVGYGLLLYLTNAIHSVGHILAANWAGAPMEILLVTATRDVTLYRKEVAVPSKHMYIARSLGGPVANLHVGVISLIVWHFLGSKWWLFFSIFNLAIGMWTLFPVPSMDGWVVWGELFGFRRPPVR